MKIIVVGGGWGGISAAYQASKGNNEVTLIERTDMLLGSGLVGGIMRNNGRFTGLEEMRYMGLDELINIIDNCCIHNNIDFPGHKHASFYNALKMEKEITDLLLKQNVNIKYQTRISKVNLIEGKIQTIVSDEGEIIKGNAFIDATGSAGPINNCIKYGNGCVSCIFRCFNFGGRISLTSLCGIKEKNSIRNDGSIGAMSGSTKLFKQSLSKNIINNLNDNGFTIIPLTDNLIEDNLNIKVCQQYALDDYKKNLIILDTGEAKLMTPYFSLNKLRKINGFEHARYIDPYCGGNGNSMRFFSLSPHDNTLKVIGIDNLFCCGEKVNLVGHTEAIITGILAGYNATKLIVNEPLLIYPTNTACGFAISNSNNGIYNEKYTLSGSVLFKQLQEQKLYTTNLNDIKNRIKINNLTNIFSK